MQNTNQILAELLEGITKWSDLKVKLSDYNTSKTKKTDKKNIAGKIFEYFSKYYFETNPEKMDYYENVWLYEEIPLDIKEQLSLPSIDHGIDILLKTPEQKFHAVQCKFKNDQTKKLSWSGDKIANVFGSGIKCDKIIVFSNASSVTKTAKGYDEIYEEILHDKLLEITSEDFIRISDKAKGYRPRELVKFEPLEHQKIAISNVVNHLSINNRAQLILPCGAGKTLTSLWIKEKLSTKNTLVMVPSLALLKQIKNDWARHKRDFYKPLYVCSEKDIDKGNSDETVTHGYEVGGPVTTKTHEVIEFLQKEENKTVFSTYQSIAVIEEACEQLPDFKFDCIICDEAHRTAGSSKSNTFTIVHDDSRIPSSKRLYMTATPKVVSTSQKTKMGDDYALLCDMSNPEIFGEEAHRMTFGEAIDLGILVDYKIVGIGVTDEQVQQYIEERDYIDKVTVEDLAHNFALEMVMNKYQAFHGLTFHSKVQFAKDFSERHRAFFEGIYARSVDGKQSTTHRKIVLDEFKNSPKGVVSNARCLTEGVDVPTIDIIYFCDPKSSKIDIVQAAGRALRVDREGSKDLGYIVVPIFHQLGENIEQEIKKNPIFNYLIQVIRSLCDQDERLEAEINQIASKKGKRSTSKVEVNFGEDEVEKIVKLEGLESRIKEVLFDEIIEKTRNFWEVMFIQLCEFQNENGHLDVSRRENPQLGNWIYEQRRQNRGGKLNPTKKKKLNEIGFDWKSEEFREETDYDEIWWESYIKLEAYYKEHGNCDIPARYKEDKPLGTWVVAQRAKRRKNELSQDRIDLLDELDFSWDAKVKIFDQFCIKLIEFKEKYGHTNVPTISKDFPKLGKWTNKYRSIINNGELQPNGSIKYGGSYLSKKEIEKLKSLGFKNSVRKTRWEDYYEDLKEFFQKHGHSRPVQSEEPQLYYWVYRNRKNQKDLTKKQVKLLEELDFDFSFDSKYSRSGSTQNWMERLTQLQLFKDEHENFDLTPENEVFEGLYDWLVYQRRLFNNDTLDSDKTTKLEEIGLDFHKDFLPQTEIEWENKLAAVKEHYERTGSFFISSTDLENRPLLSWLRYQKKLDKDGKLEEDKKKKLLDIGYSFTQSYRGKVRNSKPRNEDQWLVKFSELKEYFEKYETFLIPKSNEDYCHLIPWVQYQKKLWREENLSPEREAKLLGIGFPFDESYRGKTLNSLNHIPEEKQSVDNTWLDNLNQLKSYHEEYSTWLIPTDLDEYKSLKAWLQYQRQLFRQGKLNQEKVAKLTELGYSFDLDFRGRKPQNNQVDWEEKLEELRFYYSKYNTFLIPKSLNQYQDLKKWLVEQKRLFKNNRLTENQIEQLQSIGYSFDKNYQGRKFEFEVDPSSRPVKQKPATNNRDSWEQTYLHLVNFKIAEGHCNVPRSYENKTLANFVSRNRYLFKKGELENEKIEKLKLLQFEFIAPKTNAWENKFEELKSFYELNGHSNYQKSDGNPSIYHWILAQRVNKRKNLLDTTQIIKLDSIKFVWEPTSKGASPRDDEWFNRLIELKNYKEEFGHANVSQVDPKYKKLGRWLNDQRVMKKGRKNSKGEIIYLSNEREALLEELGVIWDMKEHEWNTKLNQLKEFFDLNGHFTVKQSDKTFDGLYYWIYKIRKSGTTREKLDKLSSIGYPVDEINEIDND